MTEQHLAAPELWAAIEKWGANTMDMANCFLELRTRIEALEAAQPNYPAKPDSSPASASSLVDRLASVGVSRFYVKAAIREVAAWLRKEQELVAGNSDAFASLLEREADR